MAKRDLGEPDLARDVPDAQLVRRVQVAMQKRYGNRAQACIMGALQGAIVSLAGGMDAESIAAIRIDDRACCAELDIEIAPGRRH